MGDYRAAVSHEKAAKAVWAEVLGAKSVWTRQAATRLAQFTRSAVMIEVLSSAL